MRRGHPAHLFTLDELVARRRVTGTTVSVCLPARNEAATVGEIVEVVGRLRRAGLVDEIVVCDDGSTDGTGDIAAAAGATVVRPGDIDGDMGTGKGEALWTSLAASTGDAVCWVDADIRGFDPSFVVRLVAPLICDPDVDFVKAFYRRPFGEAPVGGGRVTELMARPLLAAIAPALVDVVQPLSGEYAGRRAVLERVPFVQGWGVDLALLYDVARMVGAERIVQVDLGVRHHRHRPLSELGPMAAEILLAMLARAGLDVPAATELVRFEDFDHAPVPVPVERHERPPVALVVQAD